MLRHEVPPNEPENIIISPEKKTILKFYIRLYFFFIHNFRKLIEKTNNSGSSNFSTSNNINFSKQQKQTILEQYFNEDLNNINRLSNSADMFFLKPYFEHLCNNSYDDNCNDYRKYLNTMIKHDDDSDKISNAIVDQLKSYITKFNSLSLTEEKIEKIREILIKKEGNKLTEENFEEIKILLSAPATVPVTAQATTQATTQATASATAPVPSPAGAPVTAQATTQATP